MISNKNIPLKFIINPILLFSDIYQEFSKKSQKRKEQRASDNSEPEEVYFMEKVFALKENKKKEIPAVVHTDGTGRIHFVSEKSNEIFYKLIKEFKKISKVPIILNTSFNTNNVPIVESPKDALTTFYSCGIDVLYMNNIKISK